MKKWISDKERIVWGLIALGIVVLGVRLNIENELHKLYPVREGMGPMVFRVGDDRRNLTGLYAGLGSEGMPSREITVGHIISENYPSTLSRRVGRYQCGEIRVTRVRVRNGTAQIEVDGVFAGFGCERVH